MAATRRKKTDVDAALKAVSESDVKKVLDQVGTVQTNVQGTLAALGVTMTEKIEELRNLETAIGARKEELADIHDIEVQADTLDEIKKKVDEAEEDAKDKSRKRRKEWQDEQAERDEAWAREQEQHDYDRQQRNDRARTAFEAESEERQRKERIRMEDVSKSLAERIEAVEERETKMTDLEAQVENLPAEIEEAVETAKAEVTKSLGQAFSHEKAMLKKDAEAAAQLANAEQQALMARIGALEKQLENVEAQLATAREDARGIATSAVEASSQRQALATLQQSIETQANAQPGGRR